MNRPTDGLPDNVAGAIALIREANALFGDDLLLVKVNDDDQSLELAYQNLNEVHVARFDGEHFFDIQAVDDVDAARALPRLKGAK